MGPRCNATRAEHLGDRRRRARAVVDDALTPAGQRADLERAERSRGISRWRRRVGLRSVRGVAVLRCCRRLHDAAGGQSDQGRGKHGEIPYRQLPRPARGDTALVNLSEPDGERRRRAPSADPERAAREKLSVSKSARRSPVGRSGRLGFGLLGLLAVAEPVVDRGPRGRLAAPPAAALRRPQVSEEDDREGGG